MLIKTRFRIDGKSFITIKKAPTKFEQFISKLPYDDLLLLYEKATSKQQRALINLELYHRDYSGKELNYA